MGEVYLAEDAQLRRHVALKILPSELAANQDRMRRFVQEAQSAAALNHPNIAHIYEIGEHAGTKFIAMEFIDGVTLREKIHRDRVPLSKLLKYLIQVAEGLAKAHAAGIVHRDLKPDNIMITRDDYAKVLDFGLAKLVEPQRTFESGQAGSSEIATAIMQQQSIPGMVMGTVGYMSPEQASGRVNEIDHRSDIFSFGCILFEAATGQRAFEGKDALDSLHKIVHAPTPQLKDLNPLAPDDLQRVVRRCLAKEPEKRYQSMKEVALEIDDLQQELKGLTGSEYSGPPASPTTVTTSGSTRANEGFWVAVLPFKVRDTDPDVAILADGLSEEISTGLSRFRYLSVVTSASADRLKGEAGDERTLGAKLGARYVLEGSIRKGGPAIRLSTQLVDTETGAQLWAETYNRDLQTSSIFAVQDDVAARIVATVADSYGVLVHSIRSAMRQKDDVDLTPVEWQFQYFAYREQITPSNHAALRSRLARALERDDGTSDLWACLAQVYVDEYAFGFQGDATSLDRAMAAARRAVELDRANQFALVSLAQAHFFRRDLAAFGPAAERAMALNPLNSDALGIMGLQIVHTGEFERGAAIVRRAMELNANHAGWMHFAPLWEHFHKGEYEQALERANRVDVPGNFWPYVVMAAACGHLGRRADAEAAVRDLLALDPEFGAHVRSNVESWHFASGLMDPILEGLRKAGLEIRDEEPASSSSAAPLASSETRADEGFWVAVLPFKSSGTAKELKSLAEGLSEDIVMGLSRFSYLRVIARGSTLRFANQTTDLRTVGKELGARYVMEGSLRQAGTKLRLAVQLVDATTGAHLWAENYERELSSENIFELQDDLVPRIVSTVADWYGVLPHSMSETVHLKPPDKLSPYEALLRSFGYFENIAPEEHAIVRSSLERAVAQEPGNADGWAMLSMIFGEEHRFGFNVEPDSLGRSLDAARKAVAIAHANHFAWLALAQALFFRKEFDPFRDAAERAIALNPMDGSTVEYLGHLIAFSGNWERGCELAKRARQLNPNHPSWYWAVPFLDAYRKGDYLGARPFLLKGNPQKVWLMHALLAAVHGQLGESEAAARHLQEVLTMMPDFPSIGRDEFSKWYLPELVDHLMDGLCKAGLKIVDDKSSSSRFSSQTSPTNSLGSVLKSIAVLPFQNLSVDPEQEFFADGITEEILNALAQIKELRVAGRSSSFSFKGRNEDLRSVGAKLNVTSILEGTLRRSGDRLRITAQLIDAVSGYQLWSERYDRVVEDIFDIQDEIALAVVDALKLKLFGDAKEAVVKRYTDDAEVHELFLKGRYYYYKYTAEGWTRAVEFFEKVIEKHPDHAPAHAGKAAALGCLWFFGLSPADEAVPPFRSAATKAIELDGNLAGAHLSLGLVNFFHDWEWEKAEQEFKQAILLNPKDAEALSYYAMFLGFVDRFDEAMALARRALEVDPLSLLINMNVGWTYFSAGLANEAFDQARKLTEIEPAFFGAYWLKGATSLGNGDYEEAIEQLTKAVSLGGHPIVLADLGAAYALAGKKETAEAILDQLLDMRRQSYVPAICLARVCSRLGELEKTIQWLETAYEERNGELVFLESEITSAAQGDSLNSLGKDPRVKDLLERMKLPSRDQGD